MQWRWPEGAARSDWLIIAAIGAVTLVWGTLAGFTFDTSYTATIWIALALFVIAGHLMGQGRFVRTAAALATIAWMFTVGPVVSHASYVVTSANLPYWDAPFAAIDQAFGIDIPAIVRLTGSSQWFSDLNNLFYHQFTLQMLAGYVYLISTRQFERLRDVLSILTLGMTVVLISCPLIPAVGTAVYYGLTPADFGFLQGTGAATFHLEHFEALRSGAMRSFPEPDKWQGLVCFPSFHVIYTLAAAYAVAGSRWLFVPSAVCTAFIIFTTIPVGGHHVFDLAAGAAVFAALVWFVDRRKSAAGFMVFNGPRAATA